MFLTNQKKEFQLNTEPPEGFRAVVATARRLTTHHRMCVEGTGLAKQVSESYPKIVGYTGDTTSRCPLEPLRRGSRLTRGTIYCSASLGSSTKNDPLSSLHVNPPSPFSLYDTIYIDK